MTRSLYVPAEVGRVEQQEQIMSNTRPTHEAFSVKNLDNGKSFWTKIGAAWTNRDGSLTLQLDLMPFSGKIVLRKFEPKED